MPLCRQYRRLVAVVDRAEPNDMILHIRRKVKSCYKQWRCSYMDAFLVEGIGAEAGGQGGALSHSLRPADITVMPVQFSPEGARKSKHTLTDTQKVRLAKKSHRFSVPFSTLLSSGGCGRPGWASLRHVRGA